MPPERDGPPRHVPDGPEQHGLAVCSVVVGRDVEVAQEIQQCPPVEAVADARSAVAIDVLERERSPMLCLSQRPSTPMVDLDRPLR